MADYRATAVIPRPYQSRRVGVSHGLELRAVIRFAQHLSDSAHAIHCGVSLTQPGRAPQTVAATDDLPVRLDWLQHQIRQGPAVPPGVPSHLIASRDLAADQRWTDFGRLCFAMTGLRSMIAIPIPLAGAGCGLLSFYACDPAHLGRFPMGSAVTLASQSSGALGRLQRRLRALTAEVVGDFNHTAVAVNHLMDRRRMSSAAAFNLLDHSAQLSRLELAALAIQVVRHGDLPDASSPSHPRPQSRPVGGPGMWRPTAG